MLDIKQKYSEFCREYGINCEIYNSVKPYDNTTLFCPAGMSQYKNLFKDIDFSNSTIANIQPCIRLNDLIEIGDGSHLLYFNMIGLFSFRDWSIQKAIKFWLSFLKQLSIVPDYVTIHPAKFDEWSKIYIDLGIFDIRQDESCQWSDGEIGGYCTEFYVNDIEIGNIVNPLNTCIDVGFGLERLEQVLGGYSKSKNDILIETIQMIINANYSPSNLKQGYILRKLLRTLFKSGGYFEHPYFHDEVKRQNKLIKRYNKILPKNLDKTKEWWYETHGINTDEV